MDVLPENGAMLADDLPPLAADAGYAAAAGGSVTVRACPLAGGAPAAALA